MTPFLIEQQREYPGTSGTFTLLLNDIVTACKQISHKVNRGDLIGVLGSAGSENVQGEVQKKLDVITHEIMVEALNWKIFLSVFRACTTPWPWIQNPARY